jgi:hypothetical protein
MAVGFCSGFVFGNHRIIAHFFEVRDQTFDSISIPNG